MYNIKNYGALGDGRTLNTEAIQNAIDACFQNGGGKVVVQGGVYMTGSLRLKSNVCLHIESDAVLLGSPNCADYPERKESQCLNLNNLPRKRNACLIYAENCENISITGSGKIDGNGNNFVKRREDDLKGWPYERIDAPTPPRVVFFAGCRNVKVEDITMVNQPAGWSYWIHDCDYVVFNKCKVLADVEYPNNDGIHINSSRDVTISNCSIVCGDDSIVVRANNRSLATNKVCERVTVTNCNLTSYASGIRIAWKNDGTIRNCTFSNIVMTDTNTGICMQLPELDDDFDLFADQGREATLIENLSFQNIVMDRMYAAPVRFYIGDTQGVKCRAIRNIYFSNIHSRGLAYPWITGRKTNPIENVYFSDCTFIKVSDTELPDYEYHGSSWWDRPIGNEMFSYVKNIVWNHCVFTEE